KSLAFSRDGAQIATGGDEARVRVWSSSPGTAIVLRKHADLKPWQSGSLAVSDDGRRVVSVAGRALGIWDTADRKKILEKPLPWDAKRQSLSTAGDLIAAANHHTVFVADSATLETKFTLVHGDPIWSLQFSTDGRELFTRSGNDIRVWRLDSGAETRRFPH